MKIAFDLSPEQEARLNEILTQRNANGGTSLTPDELCKLETEYALGLTPTQMKEAEKAAIVAKLATLDDSKLADVAALVDANQKPSADVQPAQP